jgi:hypothetical protein
MNFKQYMTLLFYLKYSKVMSLRLTCLLFPTFILAVGLESEGVQINTNSQVASKSKTELPNAFCDLNIGIKHAYEEGRNGIYANFYTYHTTVARHLPSAYFDGNNELTLGTGYARTYFNPKYNSEYSLGVLGFFDTEYKPEIHVGYSYFKYWDIVASEKFKVGLGYSPFIFVKPGWSKDSPIPMPGVAVLGALRFYDTVNLQVWYTGSLYFFNVRVDF